VDTLYVTDLDGTLLDPGGAVSKRSARIINQLIASGLNLTVATARSPSTTWPAIATVDLRLPVAMHHGGMIGDPLTRTVIRHHDLDGHLARQLVDQLVAAGLRPIVATRDASGEPHVYHLPFRNPAEHNYHDRRLTQGDRRFREVTSFAPAYAESITQVSTIEAPERLASIRGALPADVLTITMSPDLDWPEYSWLELGHLDANKGAAIQALRAMTGARRVVCFGDSANDIPMFAAADRAYAVANALPEVAAAADAVIDAHDADAVAEFLRADWRRTADPAGLRGPANP
jgi:hypothetical protein